MSNLKTPSAIKNAIHDLVLADIHKVLISHPKAFWDNEDNRESYKIYLPECLSGKDIVCHHGPSYIISKEGQRKNLKAMSGPMEWRAKACFNLELKTTSSPQRISEKIHEASGSAYHYNEYFIRSQGTTVFKPNGKKDPNTRPYPFSIGVAVCINSQDDHIDTINQLVCASITIRHFEQFRPKLVGEYYNFNQFRKGLHSIYTLIEDEAAYQDLRDLDPWDKVCDSVMTMDMTQPPNDEYPLVDIWDSTPPPQPLSPSIKETFKDLPVKPIKEASFEQIKAKYKAKIEEDVVLTKALKPIALSILEVIDDSHGTPYLTWGELARVVKAPITRVKRNIPHLIDAQVFDLHKEHLGNKVYKYQVSLNKDYLKA